MKYLLFFTILPFLFTPRLDAGTHIYKAPATSINKVASVKPVDNPVQIQISDNKPASMAVQYHSQADYYGSPVPKTAPAPVNNQSVTDPANPLPAGTADKSCVNTNSCLNPDRPYFDGYGDEFAYDGTLIHANCPSGTIYEGMNPNGPDCQSIPTGCPNGDAVPLGDQCDKLNTEPTQ